MELKQYNEELPKPKINDREKIEKIIKGWKYLNDIPVEGEASRRWDMVFYKRYCKPAKELLCLFEDWETAVKCIEFMIDYFKARGLDYTMETVLKRSDLFREKLAKGGK